MTYLCGDKQTVKGQPQSALHETEAPGRQVNRTLATWCQETHPQQGNSQHQVARAPTVVTGSWVFVSPAFVRAGRRHGSEDYSTLSSVSGERQESRDLAFVLPACPVLPLLHHPFTHPFRMSMMTEVRDKQVSNNMIHSLLNTNSHFKAVKNILNIYI